jgi:hypothetical protein
LREKDLAVVETDGKFALHIVPRGSDPRDARFFGSALLLPLGIDPSVRELLAELSYSLLIANTPDHAFVLGIYPMEEGAWLVHSLIAEVVRHPSLATGFDYLDSNMLIPIVEILNDSGVDWEGNSLGTLPGALMRRVDRDGEFAGTINRCSECLEVIDMIAFGSIQGARVTAVVETLQDSYEVVANTADDILDWVDRHVLDYAFADVELEWIGSNAPPFVDADIVRPKVLAADVIWASYTVLPNSGPHRFDMRPRTSFAVLILGSTEPARLWGERMAVELGRVWPALYAKTWSWFAIDLGTSRGEVQIFQNCVLDDGTSTLEFRRGKASVYGEILIWRRSAK